MSRTAAFGGEARSMKRLAFTLKLSVKNPSSLRGILDEAVTPCDDWDARYA